MKTILTYLILTAIAGTSLFASICPGKEKRTEFCPGKEKRSLFCPGDGK
jgi:hypothetical protein